MDCAKEKTLEYDLSVLTRSNWHVHTTVSRCAKPEMTVFKIVVAAEAAGLETVALVDHHHSCDHDILADIARLKLEAGSCGGSTKIVVGAELSALGVGKHSDSMDTNGQIEYRLYACNHYHISGWEHPGTRSPRAYAEHSLAVLEDLLVSGRADCIAHPFVGNYLTRVLDDTTSVTKAITDSELGDILELGARNRVAWELNPKAIEHDPEFAKRLWRIGREVGAEFRFGTDAHVLSLIDSAQFVDRMREILSGS